MMKNYNEARIKTRLNNVACLVETKLQIGNMSTNDKFPLNQVVKNTKVSEVNNIKLQRRYSV